MAVVGIDACKGGWIAVVLRDGASEPEGHFLREAQIVVDLVPDAEVVAIDIPIGLPVEGWRRTDREAKGVLGARRSSLFLTPPRAVLSARIYPEANGVCKELTGAGLSHQSFGLKEKIIEVDAWLEHEPPVLVAEAHPELSFMAMRDNTPAHAFFGALAGVQERVAALQSVGINLTALDEGTARRAAVDDVLDAAAVAWTARRIRDGDATRFGPLDEISDRGRPIAIWA